MIDKVNLIESLASIPWQDILSSDTIDGAANVFSKCLLEICDKHIPNKTITIRPNNPLWMPSEVRSLMRKRNHVHKIAKRRNRPSDWANFRKLRNKVISAVRTAKKHYASKIDSRINDS